MKQDYLAYKKQKLNAQAQEPQQLRKNDKEPSQFPMLFAVFVVCLTLFVFFVARYGTKVDIEYGKMSEGPYETVQETQNENLTNREDINSGLDTRLKELQDANRAGRAVIQKEKEQTDEIKTTQQEETQEAETFVQKSEETKAQVGKQASAPEEHRVVYSKVLLGHYSSYDEAKQAQAKLKADTGAIAFVRKMGSFYALQVGSYLDPEQARVTAAKYSNMNYFVSIIED